MPPPELLVTTPFSTLTVTEAKLAIPRSALPVIVALSTLTLPGRSPARMPKPALPVTVTSRRLKFI